MAEAAGRQARQGSVCQASTILPFTLGAARIHPRVLEAVSAFI